MKKQKPILFSTPMVKAILDGSKTETRRIIKPQPFKEKDSPWWTWKGTRQKAPKATGARSSNTHPTTWDPYFCPYGTIGDILWLRETFQYSDDLDNPYIYKQKYIEDYLSEYHNNMKWKPSIFMPKEACRIFLEIIDVKIEKLHDISEESSKAEGVLYYGSDSNDFKNYLYNDLHGDDWGVKRAKESFISLWQSINGEESWDENPFVWVVKFKKIDNPNK